MSNTIPDDLKELYEIAGRRSEPDRDAVCVLIERIAKAEAELATARENLAIADQRAVTLNAEMGRMADTIARLSAPVSDEEWDWNSLARNADEWKGWFNTLIAARAKAKP